MARFRRLRRDDGVIIQVNLDLVTNAEPNPVGSGTVLHFVEGGTARILVQEALDEAIA